MIVESESSDLLIAAPSKPWYSPTACRMKGTRLMPPTIRTWSICFVDM